MMLLVYVKTIHRLSVANVSYHQVGTGLLGRMVNPVYCKVEPNSNSYLAIKRNERLTIGLRSGVDLRFCLGQQRRGGGTL